MKNEDLHSYILTVYILLWYYQTVAISCFNGGLWFPSHCDTTMLSDELIYTVYKWTDSSYAVVWL